MAGCSYPDECIYGERVALVDEQLAVALFQYAEPLGEEIEVAGQRYRIVGVIKAGKRVGDQMVTAFTCRCARWRRPMYR